MNARALFLVAALALPNVTPLGAADAGDVSSLLKEAGFDIPRKGIAEIDFTLSSLDGKQLSLSSLKGHVVLLNFWATWCGPCNIEIPSLKVLYAKLKDRGLEIVAVDLMEPKEVVSLFAKKQGMTFPVVLDSDGKVGGEYEAQGIPTTYVIDRTGNVLARKVGIGGASWDSPEGEALVEKLLAMQGTGRTSSGAR